VSVVLTGSSLTIEEVVRVARGGEGVEVAPAALERMRAARAVVERAVAEGA
jgi:histidine ammonia-lyase